MERSASRRDFLKASAAAGLGLAAGRLHAGEPMFKTRLKKALIVGKPAEDDLKAIKDAGFDGVETNAADASPAEAEACRRTAEKVGVAIHSVLRGWMQFNGKPDEVEATLKKTETALRAAAAYGADTVLLVPCRIGGMAMPKPWEFDVALDEKTGHLARVAQGDNAPYADYVKAHDHATDTSVEAVKRLIPVAEETKVVIALENVWNNLWVTPALFAHLVRRFDSKWVQAYFDIGNHVRYAAPEEFIRALGPTIAKCHVKDFRVNRESPRGGDFVNIRDGSVNWPVVRRALDQVGYSGWMTIEGGNLSREEHSKRLDLIIAGQ